MSERKGQERRRLSPGEHEKSSIPRWPWESKAHICDPGTGDAEAGAALGFAGRPASLLGKSQASKRPCLKRQGAAGKMTQCMKVTATQVTS